MPGGSEGGGVGGARGKRRGRSLTGAVGAGPGGHGPWRDEEPLEALSRILTSYDLFREAHCACRMKNAL